MSFERRKVEMWKEVFSLEWFSEEVLFIFVNFLIGLYLEAKLRIVHELSIQEEKVHNSVISFYLRLSKICKCNVFRIKFLAEWFLRYSYRYI